MRLTLSIPRIVCLIIGVVIIAVALFLGYLNSEIITFDYFFGKQQIYLMSFAYAWFLAGVVLAFLLVMTKILKLKYQNRKLQKQLMLINNNQVF